MKKYKCGFPGCTYETDYRYIHYHHIVPKSKGGSDKEYNRIWLCPNHHCRVYIPGETNGIHAVCTDESIIILGKVVSTSGVLLEYRTPFSSEIMNIKENICLIDISDKDEYRKWIKTESSVNYKKPCSSNINYVELQKLNF